MKKLPSPAVSKRSSLGIINIFLTVLFLLLLITSGLHLQSFSSVASFVESYSPKIILLICTLWSGNLAFVLVKKKDKHTDLTKLVSLSVLPVFWFAFLFVGSFFASHVLFPLLGLVMSGLAFFAFRKYGMKLAGVVGGITLLVGLSVVLSSFEEAVCWGKGAEADPTGSQMIIASAHDATLLADFNVNEGDQIGVAFRAHMACHETFSWSENLQQKYSPFL